MHFMLQVKMKDSEDTAFALKCIKKKHIVDSRQQEHIYSEKNILRQTNSNFIVRSVEICMKSFKYIGE